MLRIEFIFARAASLALCVLAALVVLVVGGGNAFGQAKQYKEHPEPAAAKTWPQVGLLVQRKDVIAMLRAPGDLNEAVVRKFFEENVLPHFTRKVNFLNPSLPKMRNRLKVEYITQSKGPSHDLLNQLLLKFFDEVAHGDYHPIARANAIMVIADLNEIEPTGPPWKKALPALVKGVSASSAIDAVRVPALRGVVRHAQAGIDADAQPPVIAAMLAVLAERTPPAERTQDGHDWIRRRAIDVVALIREPGQNQAVVKALWDVVDDASSSLPVRAAAAGALANFKYTLPMGTTPAELAKSLGKLGVDIYKFELTEAATKRQSLVADRLKQNLQVVRRGLVGDDNKSGVVALATAPAQQQLIVSLVREMDGIAAAASAPANSPDELLQAVARAGGALEATIQRGEAGGTPAVGPGTFTPPTTTPPRGTPTPPGTIPDFP